MDGAKSSSPIGSLQVRQDCSAFHKGCPEFVWHAVGFPWEELPVGTVVNDLGGGLGHISMSLHRQYPNLSFKLQDLPERVQQAQTEIWPTLCPEAIVEGKVEFKGIDILKETPIPNCDVYFVSGLVYLFPLHLIYLIFQVKHVM